MGEVFLAKQESLDRQVAVKLLPPDLAKDEAYVQNFLKEARSAAKLSHANIVGAVDCGETGGRYFFVMEYVSGETLFKLVRQNGMLPEKRALEIALQVARGLQHAHQHGLIHRDIKPKNILITDEGTAKICDFGLARELKAGDEEAEDEFLHTTPAYASPEQCRADPNLDHRTDIYSLGISLFEMLTGKRPFAGDSSREIMKKQVSEEPPAPRTLNPKLSPGVNQLVLRMLRKKPDERFKSYDELIAAIEAAEKPSPKTARSAPDAAASPVSPGRKPVLVAAAAGAALLLVLVAIWLGRGKSAPVEAPPPPPDPRLAADAENHKLIAEALAFQKSQAGQLSEYAAVRARWKEVEERLRGTPQQNLAAARRVDFENTVAKEADALAREILGDADRRLQAGQPIEALREIRKFPPEFAPTEAGSGIAKKALEVERLIDQKFREGLQEATTLLGAEKFYDALRALNALKVSLAVDNPEGLGSIRPEYRAQIEDLQRRVNEASQLAQKKRDAPVPAPAPEARPPETPAKGSASPAPPGPAPAPALPGGPAAIHFSVLRDPALRADPEKRAGAAAFFQTTAPRIPFSRAAALFLEHDEKYWNLEGPVAEGLAEYLAAPSIGNGRTPALEADVALFTLLAQKIAACGTAHCEVLQLFACARAEEILEKKGKIDPALAAQARLAKAPGSDLWGLPGSVSRIEMARFLVQPPGPWLGRAGEGAALAPDFASRLLGALCNLKESTLDAALTAERWKKLGAGAPDPAWAKLGDWVATGLKAAMTCEACAGQGKYPCSSCAGMGVVVCPACRGVGKISDPSVGVNVTCQACKGKLFHACQACNGTKTIKCGVCDAKKNRVTLPGGPNRFLVELGLCPACAGTGSLFSLVAYPCPACEGNGRGVDAVLKEFARLPAWAKTREGRGLFLALRWLARHQAPDGSWGSVGWHAQCREAGCPPAAGGAFDLGVTSLSLLAFLGAGLGPDSELPLGGVPSGEIVKKALGWILSQQKADGLMAHGATTQPMYEHLLATYALLSVLNTSGPGPTFQEKERTALRDAAQRALRAALVNQQRNAGWGYTSPTTASDSFVTAWGGLALLAAREAGIDVPKPNLAGVLQWFETVTDRNDFHTGYTPAIMGRVAHPGTENFLHHETLSAASGVVRLLAEGKSSAPVAAAEKYVQRDWPNPDLPRCDYCYWHWGTMFLAQRELRKGTVWGQWTAALLRESLAIQDTNDTCVLGSWPTTDRWSAAGGRVYATAINALTLESEAGTRPSAAPKAK
jgi:serine/threonine-protein kinase